MRPPRPRLEHCGGRQQILSVLDAGDDVVVDRPSIRNREVQKLARVPYFLLERFKVFPRIAGHGSAPCMTLLGQGRFCEPFAQPVEPIRRIPLGIGGHARPPLFALYLEVYPVYI
jgi:hypothetical protein